MAGMGMVLLKAAFVGSGLGHELGYEKLELFGFVASATLAENLAVPLSCEGEWHQEAAGAPKQGWQCHLLSPRCQPTPGPATASPPCSGCFGVKNRLQISVGEGGGREQELFISARVSPETLK